MCYRYRLPLYLEFCVFFSHTFTLIRYPFNLHKLCFSTFKSTSLQMFIKLMFDEQSSLLSCLVQPLQQTNFLCLVSKSSFNPFPTKSIQNTFSSSHYQRIIQLASSPSLLIRSPYDSSQYYYSRLLIQQLMSKIIQIEVSLKANSSSEELKSCEQLSYSRMGAEIDEEESRDFSNNDRDNQQNLKPLITETIPQGVVKKNGKINYSYNLSKPGASENVQPPVPEQNCAHSMPSRDALHKFRPRLSSIKQKDDERGSSQKSAITSQIEGRAFVQNGNPYISTSIKQPQGVQANPRPSSPQLLYSEEQVVIRPVGDSIEIQLEEDLEIQKLSERFTIPYLPDAQPEDKKASEQLAILQSVTTQNKNHYRKEKEGPKEKSESEAINKREDENYQKEMFQKIVSLQNLVRSTIKEKKEVHREEESELKPKEQFYQYNRDSAKFTAYFPAIKNELEEDLAEIKARLVLLQSQQRSNLSKENQSLSFFKKSIPKKQRVVSANFSQKGILASSSLQKLPDSPKLQKISSNKSPTPQLSTSYLESILGHEVWQEMRIFDKLSLRQKQSFLKRVLMVLKIDSQFQIIVENEQTVAICPQKETIILVTSAQFYVGQFLKMNGKYRRQGYGLNIKPNLDLYSGLFKNNYRHGKGTLISIQGEIYQGEFVHNLKHGKGKCQYANGDIYKGSYQNNEFQGRGVYIWRIGANYEGEFKKGKMDGRGHWRSENDDQYVGEYRNNLKDGWGVYTYADGRRVQALFQKGKKTKKKGFYSRLTMNEITADPKMSPLKFLSLRNARSSKKLSIFERNDMLVKKKESKDFSVSRQKYRIHFN